MAGIFASKRRESNEDYIAELNAIASNISTASVRCSLANINPYSTNFDQQASILQCLHATNLGDHITEIETKAQQTSDERLWFERISTMAFHENGFYTVGSHVDLFSHDLVDCIRDQDTIRKVPQSPTLPLNFVNSSHFISAECPAMFGLESRETENIVQRNSFQANDVDHLNRAKQPSSLFPKLQQPSVPMSQQPITFPNSNVTNEVRNVDDPQLLIFDCCYSSSKSGLQVCMTNNKVSESGWTIYFDQSADLSPHRRSIDSIKSDLEFISRVSRSPQNKGAQNQRHYAECRKATEKFEDSSMVSDASSGPEQLFSHQEGMSEHITKLSGAEASTRRRTDDLTDDACTSEFSLESISDGLSRRCRRKNKRRRKEKKLVVKASSALPLETLQVEDGNMDRHSSEGSGDNLTSEQQSASFKIDERDLIGERMEILQQLIPNSEKLDREEVLAFAIDYVKFLELKIKMFESTTAQTADYRDSMGALEIFTQAPSLVINGIKNAVKKSALQEKGLCLMPLSLLGKAYKSYKHSSIDDSVHY